VIVVGDVLFTLLIVFLVVPAPLIIILYFLTKWKQTREISSSDEMMLEELWELAHRMEERLESLEIILDSKAPDWRKQR
jgi:phage shock protein B